MIAWECLEVGSHRLTCPDCGRGPRDKTLGVTIKPDGGMVAHCFRCEFVASHRGEHRRTPPPPASKPQRPKRTDLSGWGRDLWASCRELGGVAVDYLRARNCVTPPLDGDLRWHPALPHPEGYTGPALVARVTHARTCKPLSLHRTWINGDGTKPATLGDKARMVLGGHALAGGVVRLWPDEGVTHGLGIAEGIETALSLAHGFQPVWALISAGQLGKFAPLPGIESLTIACDNDPAGIKAARECAGRWFAAGVEVIVTRQEQGDLNDVAREAA